MKGVLILPRSRQAPWRASYTASELAALRLLYFVMPPLLVTWSLTLCFHSATPSTRQMAGRSVPDPCEQRAAIHSIGG